MGNRAVIRFKDEDVGIYLHWNGGRDSVEAFLEYCKLKGYRGGDYGLARLTGVLCNFFGGTLSVGLLSTRGMSDYELSPGDNGVYIVDNWKIVGRYDAPTVEQDEYDRKKFMIDIDESMPEDERLGKEYLETDEVPTSELRVGDVIYDTENIIGGLIKATVEGFGTKYVNGTNVEGVPYADICRSTVMEASENINNYLLKDRYRVSRKEQEDEK